jgi:hypothetical protein
MAHIDRQERRDSATKCPIDDQTVKVTLGHAALYDLHKLSKHNLARLVWAQCLAFARLQITATQFDK